MDALTPIEIQHIRTSFSEVLSQLNNNRNLAHLIYVKLFEKAPQARSMFSKNMRVQEEKLLATFVSIVAYLDRPDILSSRIKELRKTHADYQVMPDHYDVLKDVLLDVFKAQSSTIFNDDVVQAWSKAYDILAAGMLSEKD